MGFAVLHIEKGTAGKAGGLGNHIERKKNVPNADPARTHLNSYIAVDKEKQQYVFPKENPRQGSLQERISKRIEEGYKGKTAIRKDAVTHLNVVMSGSHEDMLRIQKEQELGKWFGINYEWAKQKWGEENIVEFALHLDERTPHIHCVVVPLTADGRLSAKEVMGNRVKMSEMQDQYGRVMNNIFNLERGVKGSTATHDSVREFYGRIDKALSSKVEMPPQKTTYPQMKEPPLAPWKHKEWAESQNKAIREAFRLSVKNTVDEIKKSAEEQLKTASAQNYKLNNLVVAMQNQVSGLRRQIDELQHPEKYEEQRKQREEAKRAMEQERKMREDQVRKRDEGQGRKRGGFKR